MLSQNIESIFLMSSERSGSNLLTRMFDSHSQICGPPPAHFYRIIGRNLHRYGDLSVAASWHLLIDDCIRLFETKLIAWRISTSELERALKGVPRGKPALLLYELYAAEALAHAKPIVFIKENQIFDATDLVLQAPQRPRFVHLVRDPRDMALSWHKAAAMRGGILRAARTWNSDQSGFMRLKRGFGESIRCATLSYESLITDAGSALHSICVQLGLSFEPTMVEFHQREDSQAASDRALIPGLRNSGQPLQRDNAGGFRQALSDEQVAAVEYLCAENIAHYEYAATGAPRPAIAQVISRLQREEPWDKPAYQCVSEIEREKRREWTDVVRRIESRTAPRP